MARFEILDSNAAPLGEGPAAGDMLFELGMTYSVGRDMPVDLVSAHKWFNLAAMKGNVDAVRLRREVANQMSDVEIAAAQRAARDWLRGHERDRGAGRSRPEAARAGLPGRIGARRRCRRLRGGLAHLEPVHAGEGIRSLGFELVPAIEIGQRGSLGKARGEFVHDRRIEHKAGEVHDCSPQ